MCVKVSRPGGVMGGTRRQEACVGEMAVNWRGVMAFPGV